MLNLLNSLRIFVMDCPYDTLESPATQRLFAQTIAMKIRGYRLQYDYGVLPVDTTDFVGTHLLMCRETRDGWEPLTGYKSTTLERSNQHGIVFPGLGLAFASKSAAHEQAVREIIHECESRRRPLAYTSSWTMDPSVANDRETRQVLRDLVEATYVLHHLDEGISDILVGGTLRFKTDTLFSSWGHRPIQKSGIDLPPITVPHLLGERVTIMHLKEFSKEVLERAKPWRFYWNEREVISLPRSTPRSNRKAA